MPGNPSDKNSAFGKFLKENKSLVFMLPLLVILVVVLIIVYSGGDKPATSEVPTPAPSQTAVPSIDNQTQAEVLPKTERPSDDNSGDAVVQDPFTTPMKLTGVLFYGDDRTKAIIEYGRFTYIVGINEMIGDTAWMVSDIFETSVMLSSDGKSTLLELASDAAGAYLSAENTTQESGTATYHLDDADIRDVISAIVLDLGYNVVYLNDTVVVDRFDAANINPEEALSLLLKSVGLDYIQDGTTMIVGPKDTLAAVFFDSMVLTKFSLKYVNASVIAAQINNLGIAVQKITLDSNPYAIWVQGLPRDLGKVRELIAMLDRAENVSAPIGTAKLVPINFTYITAQQFNTILRGLGLPTGLVLDSNPKILYIYASESQIAQIEELKTKLDIFDNQQGADFVVSMKKLTYIKANEIVPIIYQFGLGVDVITFERTAMAVWLKGDEAAVKQVSSLIDQIDIRQNIDNNRFFIKKLKHISALEADYRLGLLGIPEIKTYTFSYPQFSKSILVVCPEDYKIFVMDHLNQMDVASDKIKVPIDYSKDPSGTYRLEQRRDLLITLTGIPEQSFTISKNVSRDNQPHYVLILEETPERIKMVEDLVTKIDNPLGNEYEPGY